MLYPEHKEELAELATSNLIAAWNKILEENIFEQMIKSYETTITILCQEAENWFKEYSDWAHSARGILDIVQQFSGNMVQSAANKLTSTAEETGVASLLEIADEWGMNRKPSMVENKIESQSPEDSLFE
jgi:hypothetical protein